ncbi:DUF2975 domain-containing protein [Pedobacter sp. P351]|uniref:DUF2975 domain-containing protein n=1 Tax=Pedobacter superstes TaxID=3133441 RepID=UPI0030A75CB1
METNSKKLIRIIKAVLDLAWYGNFILAAIALCTLLYVFTFEQYSDCTLQVNIPQYTVQSKVKVISDHVKDVNLIADNASLKMKMRNTPFVIGSSLFLLCLIEFLIFSIIYHLRKLFSSLDKGNPFTYENVKTLKISALFIALIIPVQALVFLLANFLVRFNISSVHKLSLDADLDFKAIVIAAILYIVAEIFNSGLELKKENEEFV